MACQVASYRPTKVDRRACTAALWCSTVQVSMAAQILKHPWILYAALMDTEVLRTDAIGNALHQKATSFIAAHSTMRRSTSGRGNEIT